MRLASAKGIAQVLSGADMCWRTKRYAPFKKAFYTQEQQEWQNFQVLLTQIFSVVLQICVIHMLIG